MLKDDFEVISSPKDNKRALEILFSLIEHRDSLPLAEIKKKTDAADEFLALLSTASDLAAVGSPALFRKKDDAESTKVSIWLSLVLHKARHDALSGPSTTFKGLAADDLRLISKLSADEKNLSRIKEILLKEFGIVLIIEKSFSSMKLDGVATTLPNGMPVIGLSARYPRYDYFWFTLLHELAHISLHYDQLASPIYDDLDSSELSDIEIEANRLAVDSLIPRRIWSKASVHRSLSETDLLITAKQAEVHPAVVAGLLRKKNNDFRLFSKFVNQINARKLLGIA